MLFQNRKINRKTDFVISKLASSSENSQAVTKDGRKLSIIIENGSMIEFFVCSQMKIEFFQRKTKNFLLSLIILEKNGILFFHLPLIK